MEADLRNVLSLPSGAQSSRLSPGSEVRVRLKWADIRAGRGLRDHFIWLFLIWMETVTQKRQWACSVIPGAMQGARG